MYKPGGTAKPGHIWGAEFPDFAMLRQALHLIRNETFIFKKLYFTGLDIM